MGCQELLDALLHQDDDACAPLNAEQRIKLAVDEAHAAFTDKRIGGLARRARLRYPQADLRTLDLLDERGISRELIASLSDCSWVTRHRNIVAQGYCGSGKSWIVCALARQAADKPQGRSRLLKRYSAYTVLAPGRMAVRPARGTLPRLPVRAHGTPTRHRQHPVRHPIPPKGLAPTTRRRHPRRRHHGPDRAQHHLDRNRRLQHEGTRTRPVAANQSRKQERHRQCPIPSTPVPSHNNPSAESE